MEICYAAYSKYMQEVIIPILETKSEKLIVIYLIF